MKVNNYESSKIPCAFLSKRIKVFTEDKPDLADLAVLTDKIYQKCFDSKKQGVQNLSTAFIHQYAFSILKSTDPKSSLINLFRFCFSFESRKIRNFARNLIMHQDIQEHIKTTEIPSLIEIGDFPKALKLLKYIKNPIDQITTFLDICKQGEQGVDAIILKIKSKSPLKNKIISSCQASSNPLSKELLNALTSPLSQMKEKLSNLISKQETIKATSRKPNEFQADFDLLKKMTHVENQISLLLKIAKSPKGKGFLCINFKTLPSEVQNAFINILEKQEKDETKNFIKILKKQVNAVNPVKTEKSSKQGECTKLLNLINEGSSSGGEISIPCSRGEKKAPNEFKPIIEPSAGILTAKALEKATISYPTDVFKVQVTESEGKRELTFPHPSNSIIFKTEVKILFRTEKPNRGICKISYNERTQTATLSLSRITKGENGSFIKWNFENLQSVEIKKEDLDKLLKSIENQEYNTVKNGNQ